MREGSFLTPATDGRDDEKRTLPLVRRLVRQFLRPYFPKMGLALICMGLIAGSTAANAWLMQPVLDRIFVNKEAGFLLLVAGGVCLLALIKGAATYGQTMLMTFVGQRIIADIQTSLYSRLMRADIAFFHANPTGTLISRFTMDCNLLRGAAADVLAGIGKDAVTVIFLVALMFYQDWLLALFAFLFFPLAIRPIAVIGRRMRRASADTQKQMGQFMTLLNQTFQGARHVKAYGMEDYEIKRAKTIIETLFHLIKRAAQTRAAASPLMESLGGVAIGVVILYGGWQVINDVRTPGAFFSSITALLLAYAPMKNLATLNTSLQEGLAAAQRVFAMLDVEPAIQDAPGATTLTVNAGEIRFTDVTFAYAAGRTAALEGVSLIVPPGKTVALVGPSGAGKSTILNLIPRFYDVDAGSVEVDGMDVRQATLASLRQGIALVSQEISLFDDTVRANIAYGRFGATQEEIEAAAKGAAAHDFILELPQGYDTRVGELGVKLSGGQRQRISIARAMLKNAPILLLDEATSALDTESERQVQAALKALMKGRTTLVIAHRLSTIMDADLIYAVEGGRVVEAGNHAELIRHDGLYARLYRLQFADGPAVENLDEFRAARG